MLEGNVPLIPQSLQVASIQAEQPTAKKAATGKLSDHGQYQSSVTSQRKMPGGQLKSGGNVSTKNLNAEHQSKYTFEEKHVAHLLDQVFDDDDAASSEHDGKLRLMNLNDGGSGPNQPGHNAESSSLL